MKRTRLAAAALVGTLLGCNARPMSSPTALRPEQPQVFHGNDRAERYEARRDEGRERRSGRAHGYADNTPGNFDFYLLTLSWSPEFCVMHRQAPECQAHSAFVLHGLWPQNFDGTYPQDCAPAGPVMDAANYKDIFPDEHLLQHEWQTHGTCSGLSADAYLSEARKAKQSVVVPSDLTSVTGQLQLTPQAILGDFQRANPGFAAGSFAMSCGNNRLTAVEVCLSKDLRAISCQGVKTCRANVVKVTPPGVTADE